jgi:ribosome-associated protein
MIQQHEDIADDEDNGVEVILVHPEGKPKQPHAGEEAAAQNKPRNKRGKNRHYNDEPEEELPPSKTKIKQQMHDLQDIGEQLVALSKEHLAELDIPENLRDAIKEVKRINKFGAIRRQMQYIGRLMRDIDPAPIQAKLGAWNGTSRQHVAWLHQVEHWRDRLLDDPDALTELLAEHPDADAQHLRTLIRNALKEKELGKPPKNYREIFQVLRDIIPEEQFSQP